jgi:hypothetical protein
LVRGRTEGETAMTNLARVLGRRVSETRFDARMGQLACYLAGFAILPMATIALVRHSASRPDVGLGLGLALLLALLCIMLGTLCRHVDLLNVPARARWAEFLCDFACAGLLIGGIRLLAAIGGSPAQVTLGVLLVGSLSMAVLVFGILTTVLRSLRA